MRHRVVEFTTDKRFVRRARELTIIEAMVRMYCRGHNHAGRVPLCADCAELLDYAARRLERCVFGDAKPTCTNCTVHCYSAQKREQIRLVMKWAGPRMPLRHPILSIHHTFDAHRPAPKLPARSAQSRKEPVQPTEKD